MRETRAMFAIILVLICVFVGAFGQIIWKQGMSKMDKIQGVEDLLDIKMIINMFANKYVLLGMLLYGSAFVLWLSAMSTLDISFMYPLLSLAYVITAIMAVLFLGEQVSAVRWAGIIMVVMGCLLISRS